MFGYASDEIEDAMPLTHSMTTRLGKKLNDVRENGDLWWLRPHGKSEVIELLAAGRPVVLIHRPIWPRSTLSVSCACRQSFFLLLGQM